MEQERSLPEVQLMSYDVETRQMLQPIKTEDILKQEGLELMKPRLEGQTGQVVLEPDKTQLTDTPEETQIIIDELLTEAYRISTDTCQAHLQVSSLQQDK